MDQIMPVFANETEEIIPPVDSDCDNISLSDADIFTASLPEDVACTHCLSHSQTTPARASGVAGDSVKSSLDNDSIAIAAPLSSNSFPQPITIFDHGPPGESHPRYVLINVFRI
jgi:hypothetical protein